VRGTAADILCISSRRLVSIIGGFAMNVVISKDQLTYALVKFIL